MDEWDRYQGLQRVASAAYAERDDEVAALTERGEAAEAEVVGLDADVARLSGVVERLKGGMLSLANAYRRVGVGHHMDAFCVMFRVWADELDARKWKNRAMRDVVDAARRYLETGVDEDFNALDRAVATLDATEGT